MTAASISAADAANHLPDTPWLVFLRWCLREGRAVPLLVRDGPAGIFRLEPHGTVWALGAIGAADVTRALGDGRSSAEIRADEPAAEAVRAALPDWYESAAVVHDRPPSAPLAYDPSGLKLMESESDRRAVNWLSYRFRSTAFFAYPALPVALCFDGQEVISLATQYAVTERYGEVSIDTVAWRRREGHGFRTAAFLIERGIPVSAAAVWTAEEHNQASLQLADRLGFRPVERFALFRRAAPDALPA